MATDGVTDTPRRSRSGSETRQRSAAPARMRLTADERAQLEQRAERAGMTVGAYMRHQCLGEAGPRSVRRPPVEKLALAQLLAQIGKLGGNVNQIAYALNRGDEPPRDIAAAMAEVREMSRAVLAVLQGKRP